MAINNFPNFNFRNFNNFNNNGNNRNYDSNNNSSNNNRNYNDNTNNTNNNNVRNYNGNSRNNNMKNNFNDNNVNRNVSDYVHPDSQYNPMNSNSDFIENVNYGSNSTNSDNPNFDSPNSANYNWANNMQNNSSQPNQFNGIAPEKINLLTDIIRQSQNVSSDNMIPFLMNAAATANAKGINFSDSETNLIINALKKNMSPEQISQMDNVIRLSKMIHRN